MGMAGRVVTGVVALAAVGAGVWLLRGETQTNHTPVDPDSQLAVVIDADTHRAEPGRSVQQMAEGKVAMCQLEVRFSELVGELEPVAEVSDRFRFVLEPTLDDADQTQLRGCLEDWNVDHVRVDVIEMRAATR